MTKLDHALAWADRGYGVFPLKPNGKEPLLPGGHNSATRNVAEITRLWTENPGANIGYVPGSNNCTGVDLDLHVADANGIVAWSALLAEHGEHPATLTVRTPSGGLHLLFKGTIEQNSVRLLAPGIDTRGSRGYLVAPGSTIADLKYEIVVDAPIAELPEWVRAKFAAHEAKRVRRTSDYRGELDSDPDIEMALFTIREEIAEHGALPAQGRGSDARTYNLAVRLLDYAITDDQATALMHGHWAPHFDLEWLAGKVANATTYRISEQAIKTANVAEAFRPMLKEIQRMMGCQLVTMATATWRTMRDIMNMPPIEFYHPMLPDYATGGVGSIFGLSGAGKSLIVLLWALQLAQKGLRVGYLCGEGDATVRTQAIALHEAYGLPDFSDDVLRILDAPLLNDGWEAMSNTLAEWGAQVVFIDTLATITSQMKQYDPVGALYTKHGHLGKLARRLNALVMAIDHTGYEGKHERGDSAKGDNADVRIKVTANVDVTEMDQPPTHIRVHAQKIKGARPGSKLYYALEQTPHGIAIPRACEKAEWDFYSDAKNKLDRVAIKKALTNIGVGKVATTRDIAVQLIAHRGDGKLEGAQKAYDELCGRVVERIEKEAAEQFDRLYTKDEKGVFRWQITP